MRPVMRRVLIAASAVACAALAPARADEVRVFSSRGLPGSDGIEVRVSHPAHWRKVPLTDEGALAELRGRHGRVTGILQIGRGRQRQDMDVLCQPERARTMLRNIGAQEQDARVTQATASRREGRPAFEVTYERNHAPDFMRVHSAIVCLKDTQLVVSCGAAAETKAALGELEPVCRRVLESLSIVEE